VGYNLQFEKLSQMLDLGQIIGTPTAVSGGYLHRMFCMETVQGKFAVKALNPEIMQRPAAKHNYLRSEQISNIAASRVPALPAIKQNKSSLHEIDKQYYLVFNWVDGKSLKSIDVDLTHCYKIAVILAGIHDLDYIGLGIKSDDADQSERFIDWSSYVQEGQSCKAIWADSLNQVSERLYDLTSRASLATKMLQSVRVISHGDLDTKNVLWLENDPIVIDWESAGLRNPLQDLVETALYWSDDEFGNTDQDKFMTFIRGYKENCDMAQKTDWGVVLESGFLGKLDWLEYNLKRSLEGHSYQDQELGTAQVTGTITDIQRYESNSITIRRILNGMLG
jgi:Ser/Thr protein kinase RdoA (MazF antagonist)